MNGKIIQINEEKCVGCGLCTTACKESVIQLVDGKAKVVNRDHCDGLGNCLPVCPTGAISFVDGDQRTESTSADRQNAQVTSPNHEAEADVGKLPCGCPGTHSKTLRAAGKKPPIHTQQPVTAYENVTSRLQQWPVQIKLVSPNAPYLNNSRLLIAADCTAYARADFHERFIKGKITLIGCPKLDEGDYSEKLAAILTANEIKSVTVVRMEVPCCGGIVNAVKQALQKSGKMIPWNVVTIGTDGEIIED